MNIMFRKAVKTDSKLRMAITGPSGSGKTMTSLLLATGLDAGNVALIDTERGSASKYADQFDFDVMELESFHPERYIEAIQAAEAAGYGMLVIDSLSHAWAGKDGALELVDTAAAAQKITNTFAAWKDITPLQTRMLDAILGANMHIIATMRTKTAYVLEENDRGKQVPRKVGMAPVQRDGVEYEFDIVGEMDQENRMIIHKSRCSMLSGEVIEKPDGNMSAVLASWLKGTDPALLVADDIAAIKALLAERTEEERDKGAAWIENPRNLKPASLAKFRNKLEQGSKKPDTATVPQHSALWIEFVKETDGMLAEYRTMVGAEAAEAQWQELLSFAGLDPLPGEERMSRKAVGDADKETMTTIGQGLKRLVELARADHEEEAAEEDPEEAGAPADQAELAI